MKLSKNLSLEELTVTNTGEDNTPSNEHEDKLLYVANYLVQPIRDEFGIVIVNSGYRSKAVNTAVGGSLTSQHCEGEAADIRTPNADLYRVYLWTIENLIFGQIIYEQKGNAKWIHISLPRLVKENQQALLFKDGVYSIYKGD